MTRDDLLSYFDKSRKPEDADPLHKWIGSYNNRCIILSRSFKWLYLPNFTNPKKRSELSSQENRPGCIMGIPQSHRKEISCYKPSDLWTQEDYLLSYRGIIYTSISEKCRHINRVRPHSDIWTCEDYSVKGDRWLQLGHDCRGYPQGDTL